MTLEHSTVVCALCASLTLVMMEATQTVSSHPPAPNSQHRPGRTFMASTRCPGSVGQGVSQQCYGTSSHRNATTVAFWTVPTARLAHPGRRRDGATHGIDGSVSRVVEVAIATQDMGPPAHNKERCRRDFLAPWKGGGCSPLSRKVSSAKKRCRTGGWLHTRMKSRHAAG